MHRPSSIFALLSWILAILGVAFFLFGLAATSLALPMRSGEPWMFLPTGGGCLLAGGICALIVGQKQRAAAHLRSYGVSVVGRAQTVKHHIFISFGRSSPWSVLCAYAWEGREYTVRSSLLWSRPPEGPRPTIYLDPRRPARAWVDPETIRIEP